MLLVCMVAVVINLKGFPALVDMKMSGRLVRTTEQDFLVVDFSQDFEKHPEILGTIKEFEEVLINKYNCVKATK